MSKATVTPKIYSVDDYRRALAAVIVHNQHLPDDYISLDMLKQCIVSAAYDYIFFDSCYPAPVGQCTIDYAVAITWRNMGLKHLLHCKFASNSIAHIIASSFYREVLNDLRSRANQYCKQNGIQNHGQV